MGVGNGNGKWKVENGNSVAFGTTPEGCSISRDMRSKSEICLVLLLLLLPILFFCSCTYIFLLLLIRFYEDYALMITQ